jgi:predicted DNA-binding transcriptional regulator YafY
MAGREREVLFFRLLFLHRAKARVSLESHSEEKREREREILFWRLLFFHSAKGRVSLE